MTNRWRPARLPAWLAIPLLSFALLWSGVLAWRHVEGSGSGLDRVEAASADLRLLLAGSRPPPASVVVVAIDDATVAAEGGYPLPRARVAELVNRIAAMQPKALAVDILFADRGEAAGDAALAHALAGLPHVLAVAGTFQRGGDRPRPDIPTTVGELWPEASFFDPNAVGLVNVSTDASGAPRFFPLVFQTSRGLMPAFVLRAASLFEAADPVLSEDGLRLGGAFFPLDLGRHLPVRALGHAGTVPTLSARDVLANAVPPDRIAGRLVVLGVTATAVGDTFGTAFDPVVPGVELLANGVASLTGGATLRRDMAIRSADAGFTVLAAGGGAVLLSFAPLIVGVSVAGLVLAAWLAASVVLFGHGLWIAVALPLAGILLPLALVVVARQLVQRRSVARLASMEEAFRRFQPPLLVERIRRDPAFLRSPVEQRAAVVFVDLAGFTRYAEKLGSRRLHDFLVHYHSLIETTVAARGGMVMNFMGDGAMILFGVPDPAADDGARALDAVFALRAAVEGWIAETAAGPHSLGVRLGAHAGDVTLSRLGHEAHQQVTASGDSVNLTARLMEVAKQQNAVVVVSRDLLDAAGAERAERLAPPTGTFNTAIRGREETKDVAFWR